MATTRTKQKTLILAWSRLAHERLRGIGANAKQHHRLQRLVDSFAAELYESLRIRGTKLRAVCRVLGNIWPPIAKVRLSMGSRLFAMIVCATMVDKAETFLQERRTNA